MSEINREPLSYVLAVHKLTEPRWKLSPEEWLRPVSQYQWINRSPDSFVRLVIETASKHYGQRKEFDDWAEPFVLAMNKLGVNLSSSVTTLNRVTGERTVDASSLLGKIFQCMSAQASWRFVLRGMSGNMKYSQPYQCFVKWMTEDDSSLSLSKLSFLTWEGFASDSRVSGYTWTDFDQAKKISTIVSTDKKANNERFFKFWSSISVLLPKTAKPEEWESFFFESSWRARLPDNNRLDEKHLALVNKLLGALPEAATVGLLNAIEPHTQFKSLHSTLMEKRLVSHLPPDVLPATRRKL